MPRARSPLESSWLRPDKPSTSAPSSCSTLGWRNSLGKLAPDHPPRRQSFPAEHPMANPSVMKHFLLFYEAGSGYLERRPQFRGEHLRHAWDAAERGELVVAGALADPVDGAVLMFRGKDASVAEDFARADPYV